MSLTLTVKKHGTPLEINILPESPLKIERFLGAKNVKIPGYKANAIRGKCFETWKKNKQTNLTNIDSANRFTVY